MSVHDIPTLPYVSINILSSDTGFCASPKPALWIHSHLDLPLAANRRNASIMLLKIIDMHRLILIA